MGEPARWLATLPGHRPGLASHGRAGDASRKGDQAPVGWSRQDGGSSAAQPGEHLGRPLRGYPTRNARVIRDPGDRRLNIDKVLSMRRRKRLKDQKDQKDKKKSSFGSVLLVL